MIYKLFKDSEILGNNFGHVLSKNNILFTQLISNVGIGFLLKTHKWQKQSFKMKVPICVAEIPIFFK